jgi:hypothetical protein
MRRVRRGQLRAVPHPQGTRAGQDHHPAPSQMGSSRPRWHLAEFRHGRRPGADQGSQGTPARPRLYYATMTAVPGGPRAGQLRSQIELGKITSQVPSITDRTA